MKKQDFLDKKYLKILFYVMIFLIKMESVLCATPADRNKSTFHSNPVEYIKYKIQT